MLWGFAWLAPGLAHPSIHNWDESFHQAVTRGTADTFFAPHMYVEPLFPVNLRHWWYSGIWLHKPVAVFWWGALMVKVLGTTTMALRSASLLGELSIMVMIFLMVRALLDRTWAVLTAASFVLLPFGWLMTQGHFVSDVTDISVTAFVTLGMLGLWRAAEKDSMWFAALGGAAIGVGFLTKSFLALAPLGVAGVWWVAALVGFCRGPRLIHVVAMWATAIAVATPWNVYAWQTWPAEYQRMTQVTFGFLYPNSGEDLGAGVRAADAVFNELNRAILAPWPYPFTLLAGVYLAIKALTARDGRLVGLSLWLWSTWIVHSLAAVKGHGHMWNCLPAIFVAYALTLRDAVRSPPLAAAVLTSFVVWARPPTLPLAASIRTWLPPGLIQTKTMEGSNLVEQLLIVPPVAMIVGALSMIRRVRSSQWARGAATVVAASAIVLLGFVAFPWAMVANRAQARAMDHDRYWSSTQDVGLALDARLPKKSVFFVDVDFDFGPSHEWLNLMFWSGRMAHRQPVDLVAANAKGYQPFLVSPAAEPFVEVDGVPAHASMRVYDPTRPATPPPPPPGLKPIESTASNVRALGWAAGAVGDDWSRYALFLAPTNFPSDLTVVFTQASGKRVEQRLPLTSVLRSASRLAGSAWFVFPAVGPRHETVARVEIKN